MTSYLENGHIITSQVLVLVTACVALLSDLFVTPKRRDIVVLTVSLIGLALAALIEFFCIGRFSELAFQGLVIHDDLARLMIIVIALSTGLTFFYGKEYLQYSRISVGDYCVLGLFSTLGMMVLVQAHSLLSVYLGLELLSLPLYAMVAIQRDDGTATEAALKYFIMGAIASAMLLYGFSWLYGLTGRLDLSDIANIIAMHWQTQSAILSFALAFIVVAMGFKVATVPFHMWAPDVYEGAPLPVALFLSAGPKIAGLAMILRVLTIALPDLIGQWQMLLLMMALMSIVLGNIMALVQTNIRRLLAYSAIAHVGFAVLGVSSGIAEGYGAALFYILIYALNTAAAFGLLLLLSSAGKEIKNIEDLKGLNQKNPWMACLMLIVLFSLAGVPPTAGFFIKLAVLKAVVDTHAMGVVIFSLLLTAVGAFYYLRMIKYMYFDAASEQDIQHSQSITWTKSVLSLHCLSLLYLGMFPAGVMTLCANAFS